ncbi:ABC transporter ATP-binding protein [Nocardioides antri]|uniref:ATP-binding cassette domain-containing protein n=1 Tax=Nocardioides antri TaxID=2607659 RepID=A0A5B1M1K6_9ACTN|nr:ABC transporter ATP-binding protein [Nocardioides antri]KAA1425630.1 ATP-binding cassette domain-containing protein [Nocardioides antri]
MFELRDVTFRYDDRLVLDHVDLAIDHGELVLLAGPTGVGKSTLLGVVAGLVPAFTGGTLTGDVVIDGASVLEVPARERAHLVGYVGQNPPAWFVTDTVEEELAFGMEQLGLAAPTMRRRVEETLDLLGIADLRHRDLRTLSGGQQQRVAIGSVLTTHPRLLVLDEPTSALDPTAAEDVLATVTRLVHDLGVSVLVAEHRLERVVPFADRLCLLGEGGRVRVGDPAGLLVDAPIAPPIVELGRLAGWSPLPLTVRDARRRTAELRSRLGTPPDPLPVETGPTGPVRRGPAAEVRNLVVAHGPVPALRDVDLDLVPGTVTGLMGRNGAGKSTLLWSLQGRHAATRGTVRVGGDDPHRLRPEARRRHTGLVPQSPADLLYLETVAEECAAADRTASAAVGTCAGLLERLAPGIDPAGHPRDLSEGQRLALAVSIVLTAGPPVLLLDEPTRGLDYPGKHALAGILRDLAAEGRAVLVATHDVEFVAQVADDVVVLAEGEVVSSGPVREVVAESPAFAPQVTKVLGPGWLRVDEVAAALATSAEVSP